MLSCPTCEKRFEPYDSSTLPFCSERCQRIDLRRWLGETYSMPRVLDPEEAEEFLAKNSDPSQAQESDE